MLQDDSLHKWKQEAVTGAFEGEEESWKQSKGIRKSENHWIGREIGKG